MQTGVGCVSASGALPHTPGLTLQDGANSWPVRTFGRGRTAHTGGDLTKSCKLVAVVLRQRASCGENREVCTGSIN